MRRLKKPTLTRPRGWKTVDPPALQKEFAFKDFRSAFGFVMRVAALAESSQHHPNIGIFYNKVILELSTHDAGGITAKDIAMAEETDKIFKILTHYRKLNIKKSESRPKRREN